MLSFLGVLAFAGCLSAHGQQRGIERPTLTAPVSLTNAAPAVSLSPLTALALPRAAILPAKPGVQTAAAAAPRAIDEAKAAAIKSPSGRREAALASAFDGAAAPKVVRLTLKGGPKPDAAGQILLEFFKRWPKGMRSKFAITPGGFAEAPWPDNWKGAVGWQARPQDAEPLIEVARKTLWKHVTPKALKAARAKTDYLTFAVDVMAPQGFAAPHIELVALIDARKGKIVGWTGKSLPTKGQETQLVRVSDLDSHFFDVDGERVLILGCNDLNLYSNRLLAAASPTGLRGKLARQMRERTRRFDPTIILQHPHETDTPNIWRTTWSTIAKSFPHLTDWASGVRYFNASRPSPRATLERTLRLTKSAGVVDVVIDAKPYKSQKSRYFSGTWRND